MEKDWRDEINRVLSVIDSIVEIDNTVTMTETLLGSGYSEKVIRDNFDVPILKVNVEIWMSLGGSDSGEIGHIELLSIRNNREYLKLNGPNRGPFTWITDSGMEVEVAIRHFFAMSKKEGQELLR